MMPGFYLPADEESRKLAEAFKAAVPEGEYRLDPPLISVFTVDPVLVVRRAAVEEKLGRTLSAESWFSLFSRVAGDLLVLNEREAEISDPITGYQI